MQSRSRARALAVTLLVGMPMLLVWLIAAGTSPPGAGAQPEAWKLYAHDNLKSTILQLDTATGRASTVGATGWDSRGSGLAFSRAAVTTSAGIIAAGSLMGVIHDAATSHDYLSVVDLRSGVTDRPIPLRSATTRRGMAFGPDGATIYLSAEDGRLWTMDPVTGSPRLVGPLVDATGHAYRSDTLTFDLITGQFISLLADDRFAVETLAFVDPASGIVDPIATFVDEFSVCTLARSPVPVDGPGGRSLAAGSLFFVDGRSAHLFGMEFDSARRRLGRLIDIGALGSESSGSVCGSAFARLEPLPTPSPTATPSEPARPSATPSLVATATPRTTQSAVPTPSVTPEQPSPTPDATVGICVCERLKRSVPPAVITDALANPSRYQGWRQPRNPSLPPGPSNPPRECLALSNPNVVYHPLYNTPIWVVGCR